MVRANTDIQLTTSTGRLKLALEEDGVCGWCNVYLVVSDTTHPLGAEALKYIVAHLTAFLADPSPGQRWVLSLSELHTAAYGEHIGDTVIIRIQDANARMFAKLVLTSDETIQWIEQLSQYSPI